MRDACCPAFCLKTDTRQGSWDRFFGKRIGGSVVGIIGYGRIGSKVAKIIDAFNPSKILVNDINHGINFDSIHSDIECVSKETIYANSDIITLHLPLTSLTENLITKSELNLMKDDVLIIKTSKGVIINEDDLYHHLLVNTNCVTASDVFKDEPYNGQLVELDNTILTSHMGSMSFDCRELMELQAVENIIDYFTNDSHGNVPSFEYDIQEERCNNDL